jgi:hypothetical protein
LLAQGALLLGLVFFLGIAQPTSASLTAALPSLCGALDAPDDGLPDLPVSDLFSVLNALQPMLAGRAQNAAPAEAIEMPCVARVWGRGEWALIALRPIGQSGVRFGSEDELALGYRANGAWVVALPETLYYNEWLHAIPADLLPESMKAVIANPTVLPDPSLGEYYLPYLAGTSSITVRAGVDHDNALDLSMPTGTPVLAARSGVIEKIVQANDRCGCNPIFAIYNNYVIVDHGDGEKSYYLHISTNSVPPDIREGSFVERGTVIALSGAVGYTCSLVDDGCGPHLHFEVRRDGGRTRPRFAEFDEDVVSWQSYVSLNVLALRSVGAPYGLPVSGDFTGDGRADVAAYMEDTGSWYVAASAGSGLSGYRGWLGGSVASTARLSGDFDGDGRTDALLYYGDTGNALVALATGAGFTDYTLWLGGEAAGFYASPLVGDFDGDGRADLALPLPGGEWTVAISTGSSFNPPTTLWSAALGLSAARWFAADMNGDGLDDLVAYTAEPGDWHVALSEGVRFAPAARWLAEFGRGSSAQFLGDFNGDGRADAGAFFGYYGDWYVALSDGARLLAPTQWLTHLGIGTTDQFAADFDGDGRADAAAFHAETGALDVAISNGRTFRLPARWLYSYRAAVVTTQE